MPYFSKRMSAILSVTAFTNQLVLYAAVCSSLYHLTVIAWERNVAIRKWASYKMIVTRKRIKTFAGIAWLLAVLTTTPARILTALGVDYKYIQIVDFVLTLPAVVCLVLVGYFYVMVYVGVHKRRVNDSSQLQGPTSTIAQREHGICKKVFIQTVALLIFIVPSCMVLFLGGVFPFLRTSSVFRCTELLSQLNSLLNPFLYFLAIKRFRKVILNMLKVGKPEMERSTVEGRRRVRWISTGESLDAVVEFDPGEQDEIFAGSVLYDSNIHSRDTDAVTLEPVIEGSSSSSTCEDNHIQTVRADVHQPKPRRRKPKIRSCSVINKGSHAEAVDESQEHHIKTRSQSWDGNSVVDDSSTLEKFAAEERRRRSETMPSCEGNHVQIFRVDVHQPKPGRRKSKIYVYSIITKGSHAKAADETQGHHVKTRSPSCDGNSVVEDSSTLEKFESEERRPRSKTLPSSRGTISSV